MNAPYFDHTPDWVSAFPALTEIQHEKWTAAVHQSRLLTLAPDAVVFDQGAVCKGCLVLLEGCVRVQHVSSMGREAVLYRVVAGQFFVLPVACVMSDQVYPAQGIAETDVKLVSIPKKAFLEALNSIPVLQAFVFGHMSSKFHHLVRMQQQLVFGSVEFRVAYLLRDAARIGNSLKTTHEQLAREVGTDRAVVSRTLKSFERRGMIKCGRNAIQLMLAPLQSYIDQHQL
jgi:cAMP-binding proteins - catabolite gene activator and regulatory subunit of cAMP-dependent protein kinases